MLEKAIGIGGTEAGTDEAGRGCLAGPVVAGAVVLSNVELHPLIQDSKKLSERQRYEVFNWIRSELDWSVGICSAEEIDSMNILNASIEAMHRALKGLKTPFDSIAVDGNRFKPYGEVPFECAVKGDGRFSHIAAASIVAKCTRDDIMKKLHEDYPQYGWDRNKGYPTKDHRAAIAETGACEWHRKSFQLLPTQMELPF